MSLFCIPTVGEQDWAVVRRESVLHAPADMDEEAVLAATILHDPADKVDPGHLLRSHRDTCDLCRRCTALIERMRARDAFGRAHFPDFPRCKEHARPECRACAAGAPAEEEEEEAKVSPDELPRKWREAYTYKHENEPSLFQAYQRAAYDTGRQLLQPVPPRPGQEAYVRRFFGDAQQRNRVDRPQVWCRRHNCAGDAVPFRLRPRQAYDLTCGLCPLPQPAPAPVESAPRVVMQDDDDCMMMQPD